jgi:hypothetical protein
MFSIVIPFLSRWCQIRSKLTQLCRPPLLPQCWAIDLRQHSPAFGLASARPPLLSQDEGHGDALGPWRGQRAAQCLSAPSCWRRRPAALPGPPGNSVRLPRLPAGVAASQVLQAWQRAAFCSLPGLPFSISDALTIFAQLGPFALVHIKRTYGGDAELSPLGVREPQPIRALIRCVDSSPPQRLTSGITAVRH